MKLLHALAGKSLQFVEWKFRCVFLLAQLTVQTAIANAVCKKKFNLFIWKMCMPGFFNAISIDVMLFKAVNINFMY